MLTLLLAAAACTGADVAASWRRCGSTLRDLRIEASGVRREQEPRRYTGIHLDYHLPGDGVDAAKARRAIELSITKYCSVVHSLAPDIRVTHGLLAGLDRRRRRSRRRPLASRAHGAPAGWRPSRCVEIGA